ncbi:TadE/TadG family type IV pilus assembly protein [Acidocella sp.]|uniref:TadE/TadG family type IV pilus assembly protein n=1 Tax=Acidocella sp. TaxID=50710 RepID=UPI002616FDC7|nr:pilus assembly protein TadG-related protein [Acidocella sp.]
MKQAVCRFPLFRLWRDWRGSLVLPTALMAPMLIAMIGFVADIGFWYQEQGSLQTAADAAAMSAAQAEIVYGASNVGTSAQAQPFALSAARAANSDRSALSSASVTIKPSAITVNGQSATQWVATVSAPRMSFFSGVGGLGLSGMPAGMQTARAAADYVASSSSACLLATGTTGTDITAEGAGFIQGVKCGITANSSSSSAISIPYGSAVIEGSSVNAVGGGSISYSNGYIGPTQSPIPHGTYAGTDNASVTPDPLANMAPGDTTTSSNLPWQNWQYSTASTPWTNQLGQGGFPTASNFVKYVCCSEPPGAYNGMSKINNPSNELGYGALGTTYITGGIGGSDGDSTIFDNGAYYIAGGFATNCWGQSPGLELQGNSYNMYNSNDYAFDNQCAILTIQTQPGGTYIFNGGAKIQGTATTDAYWPTGNYVFTAYSGAKNGAYYADQGNTVFGAVDSAGDCGTSPGTYWFDGGLNISNGTKNVTFCPGIYYIRNGNLTITAGADVTGTGVTFILEGTAGFDIAGGTSTSLSAPTSNCVQPAAYPIDADVTAPPYDGTDGEGICGVLIYQSRADTAADTVNEGASTVMNGWIYAPSASLTDSGAGTIAPSGYSTGGASGITGSLGIVVGSISVTQGGTVILEETGGTGGGSSGGGAAQALLMQ